MEHALTEMPLALFTTLAPIAAGSFVGIVIALLTVKFTDVQLKKLDKMAIIPLIVLAAAFIAAFFHLAAPLNAINVFSGIGRSPMSNEIVAGIVFGALLLVYCIIGLTGKFGQAARKVFAFVVAVAGLIFAVFIGNAYAIPTIISWNTVLVPLSICGFALLGGALCASLMLALAGGLTDAVKTSFKPIMLIVSIVGIALAAVCVWMHFMMVAGITTSVVSGAALTEGLLIYMVICTICALVAFACAGVSLLKGSSAVLPAVGIIFMLAAVFIARLVFYAMQISVGL